MAKRQRKRLGDLLIEAGLITQEQLKEALQGQKQTKLKLGQYMIQTGMIKEGVMLSTLSTQLRIPQYQPDKYPFEEGVAELVSEQIAQKNRVVPLQRKGPLLIVAMPDPMDITALDTVEIASNMEVEPVICSENDYEMLFSTIYGRGSLQDDTYEGLVDEAVGAEDPGEAAAENELNVDALTDMAEQAPVIRMVNSILNQAVRENASDIHISPERDYVTVRYRVDGKLRSVPAPPKSIFLPLVSRMKIMANMDIAISKIPQDGRFSFHTQNREFNVRVSSLPTIYGENLVLRLLDRNAHGLTLDELGFSRFDRTKVEQAIRQPYGMILAAGPTGSGKTTTLYSFLRAIKNDEINIITLEDPVEYRIDKIRQVQLNTKAGMTFASGLRSILRQDPDVVLVGEVRDHETAEIATQSALTGHRVLSTLHTNEAAGAITRLVEMGLEPFLVASVLLLSVSQRLVRKICPYCQEPYDPQDYLIKSFGLWNVRDRVTFMRGKGCPQCGQSGFRGRLALFEILQVDEMVQDMILHRASSQEITRAAVRGKTMQTLKMDAARKVAAGLITLEEAASAIML
ncbi:type IV pilus assembly protein PilB [Paucidesulfovibrio gracilis DSM 16080]|uniref:Type IV pilus assembly protein PilB n=1 Tax=Paucidesulfovibrio gracilis DSM 16080 TaxID=1121449 RepID=A0A1T4WAG8_9BACT|nr:GspE/PulE family protein [Paucidesulfovibrio gracilis]SKA74119.1 type IV pilus assembly protein PilB [Paucidesulfovibrio gracilis DSM 16080]